jgi:hypothetical protein
MLKIQITDQWSHAQCFDNELAVVDDIVSWKKIPPFSKMGRTSWLKLSSPLKISTPYSEILIESIKIKGVGLCDHLGNITEPSVRDYDRIHPHLGFTPEGQFVPILSPLAPEGGMTIERARNEFNIASSLIEFGCPSEVPLRLYRYDEPHLVYHPDGYPPLPLGVVVSGFPQDTPIRANAAIEYYAANQTTRAYLNKWASHFGISNTSNMSLSLTNSVFRLYGITLRKFHEAGYYRFSGMPDNYSFSSQTEEVFLIDLDSSRRLSECSKIEISLQIMRDVASAVCSLTSYILRRNNIDWFSPEDIFNSKLFTSLLSGYYDDLSPAVVEKAGDIYNKHYEGLYEISIQRHKEFLNTRLEKPENMTFQEFRKQTFRQYWFDRKETYCLIMTLLWFLHSQSSINKIAPIEMSLDSLFKSISSYTSQEVVQYIKDKFEPIFNQT